MSLLLDALKKAAEQKAEKARAEEAPAPGADDESGLDLAQVDVTDSATDEDTESLSSAMLSPDDTEVDLSDITDRPVSLHGQSALEDETGDEQANSALAALSQQMETGEDESIVFADEDISEFMGDPRYINPTPEVDPPSDQTLDTREAEPAADSPFPPPQGDETDLSQPALDAEDKGEDDGLAPRQGIDDTDLSQAGLVDSAAETEAGLSPAEAYREDTGLNLVEILAQADNSELELQADPDAAEPVTPADAAEHGRLRAVKTDEDTDLSHVEVPADAVDGLAELALEPIESEADETGIEDDPSVLLQDEDLSLLLRDDDVTSGDHATSITEEPTDHPSLLRSDASYSLSRVDPGEEQPINPADKTATVSAATGVALDTLTTEGITARAEPTSTRTYAPDNYDRTLMKLPGEDASKLFAGMKSDSDVVMTPEYAKKVFQSKSSSHRVQHLKLYSSLIVVILLGVGAYSIFEIDHEANNIESNLQALKRDPMPGAIKLEPEKEQKLFDNTGVDEQTIKLVEGAADESGGGLPAGGYASESGQAETSVVAESEGSSALDELIENEGVEVFGTIADESATVAPPPKKARPVESTATSIAQNLNLEPEETATKDANDAGGRASLQVTTSSRLGEEHQLLRAAYTAYQAGNDQLALQKYSAVLERYPANRNALLARAAINVQNNQVAAAIEDYRRLLLSNPKDSLAMTSLITVANVSPVDAETRLKLMIRDEPDSPYLNFALANAYGAQDRWREAQGHYFTALENNPHDPNYAYNLAVSLEHIAKPQVAVSYYQRALENMGNGLAMFSKEVVDQRLEILGKL